MARLRADADHDVTEASRHPALARWPVFAAALDAHFPGAIELGDYMARSARALQPWRFEDANTMGIVVTCRDEIATALHALVVKAWGKTFDGRSLGGFLSMGATGIDAALSHAPVVDGHARFALYAMPHIAISEDGVIGNVYRESLQQVSHACGSLAGVLHQLEAGHARRVIDLDDIEQSLVKGLLLTALRHGEARDLLAVTQLAGRLITEDVGRLVLAADPARYSYAVFTGVLVHGPGDVHWVHPLHAYARGVAVGTGTAHLTDLHLAVAR